MEFHQVISIDKINKLKNANQAYLIDVYRKLLFKKSFCTQHLWFNKQCKQSDIIPNFAKINIKKKFSVAKTVKTSAEKLFVYLEMKKLYSIRDNVSVYLKII